MIFAVGSSRLKKSNTCSVGSNFNFIQIFTCDLPDVSQAGGSDTTGSFMPVLGYSSAHPNALLAGAEIFPNTSTLLPLYDSQLGPKED